MDFFKVSNSWNFVVGSSFDANVVQCSVQYNTLTPAFAEKGVGDIVDNLGAHLSKSAEKPLRATALAKPFPGKVAQGVVLVLA
jgi:hypothetical protein